MILLLVTLKCAWFPKASVDFLTPWYQLIIATNNVKYIKACVLYSRQSRLSNLKTCIVFLMLLILSICLSQISGWFSFKLTHMYYSRLYEHVNELVRLVNIIWQCYIMFYCIRLAFGRSNFKYQILVKYHLSSLKSSDFLSNSFVFIRFWYRVFVAIDMPGFERWIVGMFMN